MCQKHSRFIQSLKCAVEDFKTILQMDNLCILVCKDTPPKKRTYGKYPPKDELNPILFFVSSPLSKPRVPCSRLITDLLANNYQLTWD